MDYQEVKRNIQNEFLLAKCIFGGLPLGIGSLMIISSPVEKSTSSELLVFGACAATFGLYWIRKLSGRLRERLALYDLLEKKTYAWYRSAHPESAQAGRVSCHQCGSRKINVRGLGSHTYHCQHKCVECGHTLFYSPELSA